MLVRWKTHVSFFFFTLIVPLLWASYNISKPSCLYFNLTLTTVGQKAVNCQNFKFAIDDDVIDNQILEGPCFKTWQSPMLSSVTWSAKMTVCAYPWIISLAPKKITVSSTLLIKTEASGDEMEARRKLLWFGEKLHGEGEIKLFV